MDPTWTQHEPNMDPEWTQNGPIMDPEWTQNGPKMDQKWRIWGLTHVQARITRMWVSTVFMFLSQELQILVSWQITRSKATIANLETIIDMQSWCRIQPFDGFRRVCAIKKFHMKPKRSLQKFLESERKPKVIYTDNSLEFGNTCEDLSWNHCTSTPHRSET